MLFLARLTRFATGAALILLALVAPAWSAQVIYQFSGSGSGSLGGSAFSGAAFTVTGIASTDAVLEVDVGVFLAPLQSLSVDFSGATVGALNPVYLFFNQAVAGAGFIDVNVGDVFDFEAAQFTGYDGISNLGPISVNASFFDTFSTSGGDLRFESVTDALFTAAIEPIVNAVPEPSSVSLVVFGILALAAAARRAPRLLRRLTPGK